MTCATIPTVRFAHYGKQTAGSGLTLHDLIALNARDGLLIARAEDSGNEGTYCEVCIWNALTSRFERYAFKKFLGGEFDIDGNMDDVALAEHCAKLINDGSFACNRKHPPLIHHMPSYAMPDSDELKQFNIAKSAPKLFELLRWVTRCVQFDWVHGTKGTVIKPAVMDEAKELIATLEGMA